MAGIFGEILGEFATALLSAFGLSAPVGGETFTASSALNSFGAGIAGGTIPQNNPSWPSGWLNILVFDKNYALVDAAYQQLDGAYVQTGATKMPHQQLSKTVYIKEAGYVYIYVSNEGSVVQDIYFDDMKVTHSKSPMIQQEDYYAFGLTFNEYQRTNSVPNRSKFNGVESQTDLQLDLYQTTFRFYDGATGRFFQNDPLADLLSSISPYHFGFNNPILFSDPLGLIGTSGADGFTNEEWVATSRQGGATPDEQNKFSKQREEQANQNTTVNGVTGVWRPFGTIVLAGGKLIRNNVEGYSFSPTGKLSFIYSHNYDGDLDYPPKKGEDLGNSRITRGTYTKNASGGYDVDIYIEIQLNKALKSGTQFSNDNPGSIYDVLAHELGHGQQLEEALKFYSVLERMNSGMSESSLDLFLEAVITTANQKVRLMLNREPDANKRAHDFLPPGAQTPYNDGTIPIKW